MSPLFHSFWSSQLSRASPPPSPQLFVQAILYKLFIFNVIPCFVGTGRNWIFLFSLMVLPSTSESLMHRESGGGNLGPHRASYPALWLQNISTTPIVGGDRDLNIDCLECEGLGTSEGSSSQKAGELGLGHGHAPQ